MKDSGPDAEVSEAGRSFECPVCRRAFGYKHVLQNHERTHTGEKPFECPECHKRFTRDHHLKTHLRLHTGERPYRCPHCERHFVQVANLRRHLRVHTGERPYACGACEARFSDSNQLRAHTLIHRGEKPFQCPECAGRFRRRHHLAHHKCPKDEANAGRPRRGRRPKAYDKEGAEDEEEDKSPLVVSDENSMSEDIANNHASDDSGVADTPQQSSPNSNHSADDKTVEVTVVIAKGGNGVGANHCLVSGSVSGVVETNNHNGVIRHERLVDAAATTLVNGNSHLAANKIVDVPIHANLRIPDVGGHQDRLSLRIPDNHQDRFNHHRRKPSRTVRILTPQQREMFLRDKVSMQTQAIDMSLSPSSEDTCSRVAPVTVIVPNRFLGAVEGVLDLSSSRSDSDMEDCPPCRPPNQRITSKVLEPLNGRSPWRHLPGSDDSNGSHANEDDRPLSVIRLTTKKVHVATA